MSKLLMSTVAAALALGVTMANAQAQNDSSTKTVEKSATTRARIHIHASRLKNSDAMGMLGNEEVDNTTGSRTAKDSGYYGSPTDGSSLYEQPPEGKYGIRPSH